MFSMAVLKAFERISGAVRPTAKASAFVAEEECLPTRRGDDLGDSVAIASMCSTISCGRLDVEKGFLRHPSQM